MRRGHAVLTEIYQTDIVVFPPVGTACPRQASVIPTGGFVLITIKCQACGKKFSANESHAKRSRYNFCSRECSNKPSVPCKCKVCGTTFLAAGRAYQNAKFCSTDCRNQRNRDEEVHKNGQMVTKICNGCGKSYTVRSSYIDSQKFCSRECGHKYANLPTGKNNHKWKPKILVTCSYCGKTFETFPSRAGRRQYCCKKHRILGNLQRLAQNPRTNIEIEMGMALRRARIAYEEQVTMYDKFMVDFKLTNHAIVIQCDGTYWHSMPDAKRRDKGQDAYLSRCGYIVLRFNEKQILSHIDACIATIKKAIADGQMSLINY